MLPPHFEELSVWRMGGGGCRFGHRSKTENRIDLHRPAGLPVGQALQRGAGHINEIRRHQRQHARGEEADQAGNQGGQDGDVGMHGALDATLRAIMQAALPTFAGT